jgi:hypothetical protein
MTVTFEGKGTSTILSEENIYSIGNFVIWKLCNWKLRDLGILKLLGALKLGTF